MKLVSRKSPPARTHTLSPVTVPTLPVSSSLTYSLLITLKQPFGARILNHPSVLPTTTTFSGAESFVHG